MTTSPIMTLARHLFPRARLPDETELTDGQLLTNFIERRDEAAFADLVFRHGPMVWRVCRRVLTNQHDAEDAFQATFLVLVRKAASVRPREMLANWLHGVAHTTAHRARVSAAQRGARERQVTSLPERSVTPAHSQADLRAVLDRELSRLPEKYRILILLCDLEDRSRKEVARQLAIPEGTVAGRLARARVLLARRLARQGCTLWGGLLAANALGDVPPAAVSSTINAGSLLAAGRAAAGAISVRVATLSGEVLKTMSLNRLKIGAVLLAVTLACCGVSAGVGTFPHVIRAATPPDAKTQEYRTGEPVRAGKYDLLRTAGKFVVEKIELSTGTVTLSGGTYTFREIDETGREPSVPYGHASRLFQVTSTTRVIIDGKVAKLADLKTGSSVFVKYVVKNRTDPDEQHETLWIEAVGEMVVSGTILVRSVNLSECSITVELEDRDRAKTATYKVAKGAKVVVDGKELTFADLKPNMRASLQRSAVNESLIVRITAKGPRVDAVVRAVDAMKGRITVRIKDTHLTAPDVTVAKNARVILDGHDGKLSDLRVGMTVTLQMSAESEPGFVVGISTGRAPVLALAIEVLKTRTSVERLKYAATELETIGKPAVPALLELLAQSEDGICKDIILSTLEVINPVTKPVPK
jgi:RNA polymerase sigma factor (sigma-70 family)